VSTIILQRKPDSSRTLLRFLRGLVIITNISFIGGGDTNTIQEVDAEGIPMINSNITAGNNLILATPADEGSPGFIFTIRHPAIAFAVIGQRSKMVAAVLYK